MLAETIQTGFTEGTARASARGAFAALRSPAILWVVAPAVAGWLVVFYFAAIEPPGNICAVRPSDSLLLDQFQKVLHWTAMIAAMMLLLLLPHVHVIAARTPRSSRHAIIALFVAGYAIAWIAFGTALIGTAAALGGVAAQWWWLAAAAYAAAALWQISPMKKRTHNRCHGFRPLRAHGWRAGSDAVSFGVAHGTRCLGSCALIMVPLTLAAHSIVAMMAVSAILLAERLDSEPNFIGSSVILLLLGALSLL